MPQSQLTPSSSSSDGFYKGIVNIATLEKALRGRADEVDEDNVQTDRQKRASGFNGGNGGSILFVLVLFPEKRNTSVLQSPPTPIVDCDGPLRAREKYKTGADYNRGHLEGMIRQTTIRIRAPSEPAAALHVRVGPPPPPPPPRPPPLSGSVLLNLPEWVGSDFAISLFSLNDLDCGAELGRGPLLVWYCMPGHCADRPRPLPGRPAAMRKGAHGGKV